MRVLFISTNFPRDLRTKVHGIYKRMEMFIDAIKDVAELDMLFYVPPDVDVSSSSVSELERSFSKHWNAEIRLFLFPRSEFEGRVSKWKRYGAGAFNFFKQSDYINMSGSDQLLGFEGCLRFKPDVIFVHRLGSMCPLLLTRKTLPRIFLDLDDIEHIAFIRSISQLRNWYARLVYYTYLPALCWGEYRAIRLADQTFVCSESDRRYLANRWRMQGVVTIPNGVRIPEQQNITPEPTLLFIGSYSYKPNVEAATFLIEQVWPRIYQGMPMARLIIAGAPPNMIRGYGLSIPGVKFTGFVEDLDDLYRQSRVVCAPILSGGGTRIKIIEAAAYGKPIVSTRIGAEGIEMRDGCELVLRDDPDSFAEACLRLLKDTALCERLGSGARAIAAQHYDQTIIKGLIKKYLKNVHDQTDISDIS